MTNMHLASKKKKKKKKKKKEKKAQFIIPQVFYANSARHVFRTAKIHVAP